MLTAELADQVGQRRRQEVPDIVARCRAELCTLALRSCTARVLGRAASVVSQRMIVRLQVVDESCRSVEHRLQSAYQVGWDAD